MPHKTTLSVALTMTAALGVSPTRAQTPLPAAPPAPGATATATPPAPEPPAQPLPPAPPSPAPPISSATGDFGYGSAYGCEPPPPAPPTRPGVREHDGLYLRLGLGGGYFADEWTVSSSGADTDASYAGGAVSGEMAIGGTPAPGFVVGLAFTGSTIPRPALRVAGEALGGESGTLDLSVYGLLIDYYFVPSGGAHAEAVLGLAELARTGSSKSGTEWSGVDGVGGNLGAGYEWWIRDQWAVGLLARLTYATMRSAAAKGVAATTHSVLVPALILTATYH